MLIRVTKRRSDGLAYIAVVMNSHPPIYALGINEKDAVEGVLIQLPVTNEVIQVETTKKGG